LYHPLYPRLLVEFLYRLSRVYARGFRDLGIRGFYALNYTCKQGY